MMIYVTKCMLNEHITQFYLGHQHGHSVFGSSSRRNNISNTLDFAPHQGRQGDTFVQSPHLLSFQHTHNLMNTSNSTNNTFDELNSTSQQFAPHRGRQADTYQHTHHRQPLTPTRNDSINTLVDEHRGRQADTYQHTHHRQPLTPTRNDSINTLVDEHRCRQADTYQHTHHRHPLTPTRNDNINTRDEQFSIHRCRQGHTLQSPFQQSHRQPWTPEEIAYLKKLDSEVDRYIPNRMAVFLSIILKDPAGRRIFHPRHIESSARLRAGYRSHVEGTACDQYNKY